MVFEFRRISTADIVARLQYICDQEGIKADQDLLVSMADRASGSLRDAVMTLDQVSRVGITTASGFSELLGERDFGPELLSSMLTGDHADTFALIDKYMLTMGDARVVQNAIVRTLRDLLVLHGGGTLQLDSVRLEQRKLLMSKLASDKVLACCRILWELKTKIRSDDPRSSLDLAVVMAMEVIAKTNTPSSNGQYNGQSNGHQKLTLGEMKEMTLR